MRLQSIRIARFRNVVDRQEVSIEEDVTCLVGKNESGKTSILQALHRLNPANARDSKFELTIEYPRWRLSRDRRQEALEKYQPIEASFALEDADLDSCKEYLSSRPPNGTQCTLSKSYDGTRYVGLKCDLRTVIQAAIADADIAEEDSGRLLEAEDREAASTAAKDAAKLLREQGQNARAKALAAFSGALAAYGYLTGDDLDQSQHDALAELLPAFFYFSDYDLLPGQHDLHLLAERVKANGTLDPGGESVLALLNYAGAHPGDFLGNNYDERKAELQAAALDLTRKVFTYWTQNRDLEVDFDTELEEVDSTPDGHPIMHRMLKVLLRDNRHGGIVTNFETRSAGFRWFFSFLAAFSQYQESPDKIIVLLDEPGTSLHGEAQKDFLRFIFKELGSSQQVIYTTHSQHMVDPSRYEKLRAVEDRSTREDPDRGVYITTVDLSADRDTLLPVQAALGYSISQHLFLGAGRHLVAEGGSDFVYLQRFSERLEQLARTGLDPRLKIVPVGSAGNVPAYVALIGRDLQVSVLLDGDRSGREAQRVLALADKGLIRHEEVVVIADVKGLVAKADIEDLFEPEDYLRLFNWAFKKSLSTSDLPKTTERLLKRIETADGVFDHGQPAQALTARRDEFFATVHDVTLHRFEALLTLLNATVVPG